MGEAASPPDLGARSLRGKTQLCSQESEVGGGQGAPSLRRDSTLSRLGCQWTQTLYCTGRAGSWRRGQTGLLGERALKVSESGEMVRWSYSGLPCLTLGSHLP